MRLLLAFAMMLITLIGPAWSQDDQGWKQTVTGQIEALRAQDGPLALSFAGAAFRTQFEAQPEAFYGAIVGSGYLPIAESRSHSFGDFTEVSETVVTQAVTFVGQNQKIYEAIYQLVNEPDEGWRVAAVVLRTDAGIAI